MLFTRPILLIILVTTGIFLLDWLIVPTAHIELLYILPVMLGLLLQEKNDIVLLGLITTILTIFPFFLPLAAYGAESLLWDRFISIGGIWAAVYLVLRIMHLKEEENLRTEQFRALFEYASTGIVVANHKGQIVRVNPFAEKLFGYSSYELMGESIEMLIPQRLREAHRGHRRVYQSDPAPRAMGTGLSLQATRKDGVEFPVEVSLSPFKTSSGDYVMAFVLDNTTRLDNEQRILRQNLRLEQLAAALQNLNEGLEEKVRERTVALERTKNNLAAALDKERELGELKTRFVSMASHEFRTPLSTVMSSASLIRSYTERGDLPGVYKHIEKIKSAVNSLNTILTEFLSIGRLEEGKTEVNLQAVDLPTLVQDVREELGIMMKPGQELAVDHRGPSVVALDPGLFKHVLLNLVSNAIKYSPEACRIEVLSENRAEGLRLEVRDQGMGIPEGEQKHLFTRFFRASNASNVQGTGLGLHIVQRYVELMGGHISVDSRAGAGSCFRVDLPAQEQHQPG
jgi:PAS domain S-box-containing protein